MRVSAQVCRIMEGVMSNKSMNVIAEALMRQLGERPFEEISISQICENAAVARKTFYNNFGSKEAVVEHVAQKLLQVYQEMIAEEKADSLKDMAYLYFRFGERFSKVLSVFIENNLFYLFVKQFDEMLPAINTLLFGDKINEMGDDIPEWCPLDSSIDVDIDDLSSDIQYLSCKSYNSCP